MAVCEPGSRPLPDNKSAGALILDFPASMTVRHKVVIYKPLSLWYCYSSLNQLRQLALIVTDVGIIYWLINNIISFAPSDVNLSVF